LPPSSEWGYFIEHSVCCQADRFFSAKRLNIHGLPDLLTRSTLARG